MKLQLVYVIHVEENRVLKNVLNDVILQIVEVLLNLFSFFLVFLLSFCLFFKTYTIIVGKHVAPSKGRASKVGTLMGSVMGPTKGLVMETVMKHLKT